MFFPFIPASLGCWGAVQIMRGRREGRWRDEEGGRHGEEEEGAEETQTPSNGGSDIKRRPHNAFLWEERHTDTRYK